MTAATRDSVIRRGFAAYVGQRKPTPPQGAREWPSGILAGWRGAGSYGADRELEDRFTELVDAWREETALLSSVSAICTHQAYQQIIGMGPAALPLILRELDERPALWSWALRAITRVQPTGVRPGDVHSMAAFWTEWGKSHGHL